MLLKSKSSMTVLVQTAYVSNLLRKTGK